MKITFLQTGGTIDKDYPHTTKGWAFEIGEPAVTRILDCLNPSFEYEILSVFKKDSLEITDEDRQELATFIKTYPNHTFIITHGTDTLIETAKFLAENIDTKLLILTGAMRPEWFRNSDAAINIGAAIGAANLLDSGVYISMHGIVKPFSQMERNVENGQFCIKEV